MIAIDANSLALLINPLTSAPVDPATGLPVTKIKERFDFFQKKISSQQEMLLIPTPALAEILVGAGDAGPQILDRLSKSAKFKIAAFDLRAAVEVAAMTREAVAQGDKKDGSTAAWAKVKYDRQIIAIAKLMAQT